MLGAPQICSEGISGQVTDKQMRVVTSSTDSGNGEWIFKIIMEKKDNYDNCATDTKE